MATSQSHPTRLVPSSPAPYRNSPILSSTMADGPFLNTPIALKSGDKSGEHILDAELARGILPTSAFLHRFPVYLAAPIPPTCSCAANPTLSQSKCI